MKTALLLLSVIGVCVSEYCGWHGDISRCTTLCTNGFHLTCVDYQCTCVHSAPDYTCSSVDKCSSLGKCPVNMHWQCLSDGHCHCRPNVHLPVCELKLVSQRSVDRCMYQRASKRKLYTSVTDQEELKGYVHQQIKV